MNAVDEIRKICDGQAKVSGMTSTLLDTKTLSDSEVAIYVCIAVLLCLIVLQIALDSYFAPILLLTNIGFAVLYNMGTNIFLGEISYITKAISAVLQLGVTMDFAIFLYHSYIEQKEIVGKDKKVKKNEINDKAMSIAITKTMTSVLGSAITTMAGFIALCSMNLTLGKDIGIVMAKGVLIGLLCAITLLPSLILVCDKLIEKTKHKPLLPKFNHIKEFNINTFISDEDKTKICLINIMIVLANINEEGMNIETKDFNTMVIGELLAKLSLNFNIDKVDSEIFFELINGQRTKIALNKINKLSNFSNTNNNLETFNENEFNIRLYILSKYQEEYISSQLNNKFTFSY